MRIGAHVATRGGLMGAVAEALACGADAAQIWGSNPRAWTHPNVSQEVARAFGSRWRAAGLGPLFLHAPYMVNVASPSPEFRRRSVDLAVATVALADAIEADGVVVHAGSAGARTDRDEGIRLAAASFVAIASRAKKCRVLVELLAGGVGTVASTWPQAVRLLRATENHPRIAVCADTCHLFAAGYALDEPDGASDCFDQPRRLGIARRVLLIHANDSKHPRGMHRDAHEHIGAGRIGETGFRSILSHPLVRRCAVVAETRGRTEEHARDIAALRRLAGLGST